MNYTECALTPAEQTKWDETRTALMWQQPAFTHIFYELLLYKKGKNYALFTKDLKQPDGSPGIAATDGKCIVINPEAFFKCNLMQRVFVLAHEILHCIFNHLILMHTFRKSGKIAYDDGTSLPFIHTLMNVATDLVINDLLVESKVGEFLPGGLHDKKIVTGKDSWADAYKKLFKQAKSNSGKKPQPGDIVIPVQGKGFDEHLEPGTSEGKDASQAAQERNETEWQTQVAAATQLARLQGKLPAALERVLGEVLEPKVDWKEKIQSWFARKVGSGSYDFRRADRRLIVRDLYAPSKSGFGAGTVVVAGDTSGSIDYGTRPDGRPSTGQMFLAEMSGILEDVKPRELIVIWCDAAVGRVDEIAESGDLANLKDPPGGGGTDFRPVFDKIAELGIQPEALVYLTDGYGTFPSQQPNYPVIWGSITPEGGVTYPFGDVVVIPKQA